MSCGTYLAVCAVCISIMCYRSCARYACSTTLAQTRHPPLRCVPEVVHVRTLIPHAGRDLLAMEVTLAPLCSVTLESSYYYALFDARYNAVGERTRAIATNEHEQRLISQQHAWCTRASSSVTLRNVSPAEWATVRQTLSVKKMRMPLSVLASVACTCARLALFPYAMR